MIIGATSIEMYLNRVLCHLAAGYTDENYTVVPGILRKCLSLLYSLQKQNNLFEMCAILGGGKRFTGNFDICLKPICWHTGFYNSFLFSLSIFLPSFFHCFEDHADVGGSNAVETVETTIQVEHGIFFAIYVLFL